MSFSIFTSASSMSSLNAMNKANSALSTAMERLGTGKRINSAADDAAGLQIATRMQGESNGMAVAQRNIADATSMLQTGEGAFDEVTNIMYRMKDLATQGANDTNSQKDRDAINSELTDLNGELNNIMDNTSYAGDKLFGASGKFGKELNFQIGASTDETMKLNMGSDISSVYTGGASGAGFGILTASGITDASSAQTMINTLNTKLDEVGAIRSKMGASINRLGHTAANLANMKDNTDLAKSNIEDADFATEASTMSRSQMLAQTSMSMLKQSNSMSGMVMSLLG